MEEIEAAQQRIRRYFGGAQDVAATVSFGLAEPQKFEDASLAVTPDPSMDRRKHSIEPRGTNKGSCRLHCDLLHTLACVGGLYVGLR
jgi:hypothetical protein